MWWASACFGVEKEISLGNRAVPMKYTHVIWLFAWGSTATVINPR